jgi:hypothetical protein
LLARAREDNNSARARSLARAPLSDPYFTERAENYCYICQAAEAAFFSFLQKKRRRARLDKGRREYDFFTRLPTACDDSLHTVACNFLFTLPLLPAQAAATTAAAATLVYNNVAGSGNFFALIMWNRADGGGRFHLLNLRPRARSLFRHQTPRGCNRGCLMKFGIFEQHPATANSLCTCSARSNQPRKMERDCQCHAKLCHQP